MAEGRIEAKAHTYLVSAHGRVGEVQGKKTEETRLLMEDSNTKIQLAA
jgi:hypothetical protein